MWALGLYQLPIFVFIGKLIEWLTIHRVRCLILSFSFVFLFRVNALMNHFYLNYISNASVSWTDIATGVSAEFLKSCFVLFPSWETWKPSGLPFVKILTVKNFFMNNILCNHQLQPDSETSWNWKRLRK